MTIFDAGENGQWYGYKQGEMNSISMAVMAL